MFSFVECLHDVRVVEQARQLGFGAKHACVAGVAHVAIVDHLDGDEFADPPPPHALGHPDLGHAAATDPAD
ncbi:MAG: hypothetical protein AAGF11_16055 [Myxococcota bacterium]